MGHVKGNLKEFEKLMTSLDRDSNGVIDYSEFLTAAVSKQALLSQQNLEKAFKMIDSDGNGTISINELQQAIDIQSNKNDKIWKDIMN